MKNGEVQAQLQSRIGENSMTHLKVYFNKETEQVLIRAYIARNDIYPYDKFDPHRKQELDIGQIEALEETQLSLELSGYNTYSKFSHELSKRLIKAFLKHKGEYDTEIYFHDSVKHRFGYAILPPVKYKGKINLNRLKKLIEYFFKDPDSDIYEWMKWEFVTVKGKKYHAGDRELILRNKEIAGIAEIKALRCLKNIQVIDISDNQVTELKGLDNFINLQKLDLRRNQIEEIKNLDKLTNLKILYLYDNQIAEIKGLETLTNLQELNLIRNQIKEIKGLEKLINLETLALYRNRIDEIKGLENLTNLKALHLDRNQIKEIKGLEHLTKLEKLNLSYNQIKEIKNLDKLTNLKILYLSDNQIAEIKELETLTNLQELTLFRNQIKEIKGLEHLTSLKKLNLVDNQITEFKGLNSLTNLKTLSIIGNPIRDDEKHLAKKLERDINAQEIVKYCREKMKKPKEGD